MVSNNSFVEYTPFVYALMHSSPMPCSAGTTGIMRQAAAHGGTI